MIDLVSFADSESPVRTGNTLNSLRFARGSCFFQQRDGTGRSDPASHTVRDRSTTLKAMSTFRLQFATRRIPKLARDYRYGTVVEAERERRIQFEIGPAATIRGYFTFDEFIEICLWKTRGRSAPLVAANNPEDVEEATRIALSATSERIRIGVLRSLSGVDWPTASVFLHFGHADRYPILDFRTLEALGIERNSVHYNFELWSAYVAYCRELATRVGVSMRELDRAMWHWSADKNR